jgi:hypothetical protein
LKLETLAQTRLLDGGQAWFSWFIATSFAYKHYDTISITHVSRTRVGLIPGKNHN